MRSSGLHLLLATLGCLAALSPAAAQELLFNGTEIISPVSLGSLELGSALS